MITLIAAMARNRVIGVQNSLPWHLPEDLKHFKRTTLGHPMIMGRKTYESLPGILPNRMHLVLTTGTLEVPENSLVQSVPNIPTAFKIARLISPEIFVIGGANVYAQTLPFADRLIITQIDREYEGDAFFPEVDPNDFRIASVDALEDGVNVCTYLRKLSAY